MVSFNPACYVPGVISNALPSAIACPPPPSAIHTIYDTLTSPFSSTFTVLGSGMDALMSLPFFSFLLIPTMTSYSTSLNLLFFYLTWSTLILSHPPLRVEIVASLAVKILFYILPSLLFLAFDVLVPSLSESFKSLGSSALPLKDLSRKNTLRQAKILAWSLINILISIACQAATEYTLVEVLGKGSALKVTTTLPLPWAILNDLLRGLLLRDALTFVIHRYLLHSSITRTGLFSTLTNLHASWYHTSVRAPFPLSSTHDHPIPHLLKTFIPTYFPAYFWRFHLLTYILYLILISLEETFTHSGYSTLPTNFILGGIARRNEMHCLSHGEGNFGTWGLTDWACGTGIGGDAAEDLLDELQEAEIKEKMARQVRKGVRGVRGARRKIRLLDEGVVNGNGNVTDRDREYTTGGGGGSGSASASTGGKRRAKSKEPRKVSYTRKRNTRRTAVDSDYEDQ